MVEQPAREKERMKGNRLFILCRRRDIPDRSPQDKQKKIPRCITSRFNLVCCSTSRSLPGPSGCPGPWTGPAGTDLSLRQNGKAPRKFFHAKHTRATAR